MRWEDSTFSGCKAKPEESWRIGKWSIIILLPWSAWQRDINERIFVRKEKILWESIQSIKKIDKTEKDIRKFQWKLYY